MGKLWQWKWEKKMSWDIFDRWIELLNKGAVSEECIKQDPWCPTGATHEWGAISYKVRGTGLAGE